jgi:hypothetical protein
VSARSFAGGAAELGFDSSPVRAAEPEGFERPFRKKGSGRACLCNFLRKISPLISKNFLKKKNAFTCLLIDVDLIWLRHQ